MELNCNVSIYRLRSWMEPSCWVEVGMLVGQLGDAMANDMEWNFGERYGICCGSLLSKLVCMVLANCVIVCP